MENKFKHTLETKPIVVRQDDAESSTWLEENAGAYYPLVRIRETVLPLTSVTSMKLEIGAEFLPYLSVTINDDDFNFRETDFIENIDVLTIFIGSAQDTLNRPVKNDYLIKRVTSSAGDADVTFDCELHVPKLYNSSNRVFSKNSIEVLEQLAKDCNLGFTTNVSGSSDNMNWIQYQNNVDFIHEVAAHSFISLNSSIRVFIDQFANLNVIDLSTILSSNTAHKLEINPTTGEKLKEPIDLILTSNKLDTDNPAKVSFYTPTNSYGEKSKYLVNSLTTTTLDYATYSKVSSEFSTSFKTQLSDSSTYTALNSENTHEHFQLAPAIHENNLRVLQGTSLSLDLDWSIQSLYMMQVVPVDIYNIAKRTQKESPDANINLEQLSKEEPTEKSNAHIRNEKLSGNCLITGISWSYYATSTEANRVTQHLKVFKVT